MASRKLLPVLHQPLSEEAASRIYSEDPKAANCPLALKLRVILPAVLELLLNFIRLLLTQPCFSRIFWTTGLPSATAATFPDYVLLQCLTAYCPS